MATTPPVTAVEPALDRALRTMNCGEAASAKAVVKAARRSSSSCERSAHAGGDQNNE
jgi:hypothetical protein